MNSPFPHASALQIRLRAAQSRVKAFESGSLYVRQKQQIAALLKQIERERREHQKELAEARRAHIRMRKRWEEVFEDLEKEHEEEIRAKNRELAQWEKKWSQTAADCEEEREQRLQEEAEKKEALAKLAEEREKNRKLTAQVNRDFENSSISSSLQVRRKKIPNSREETGRKPGGQPGHKGHRRRWLAPTERHHLKSPKEYRENPEYEATGTVVRKERVFLEVGLRVVEYTAEEYRNKRSGKRVHAPFPEGYTDEVNYDGSVKAFVYLLGNDCNVSHDKARRFLSELTGGRLRLSKGMLSNLYREFSEKTRKERNQLHEDLLAHPVMHIDFTHASVNGNGAQVLICAEPESGKVLFLAREHKGHKGIVGSPAETYVGTLVHDHDTTFYQYGQRHQECMQHNIRYLKGSIENEGELTWNQEMLKLLREMVHDRNGLGEEEELDPQTIQAFEKRYEEVLRTAAREYEEHPPSTYYREGYNLQKRLREYKESQLLFLKDKRVPSNNSLCERNARAYKRKQKQAMTLRSFLHLGYLCDGMSVLASLRAQEENVYEAAAAIFHRPGVKNRKQADTKPTQ